MSHAFTKPSISADAAQRIVAAAVVRAKEIGVPVVVAVLDESGLVKALCRMDGAPVVSLEAAQNKAFTALLGLASADLFHAVKDDPALVATLQNTPRMALIPGGLPIVVDQGLIGALGIGGGSTTQDVDCARAGLAALAET